MVSIRKRMSRTALAASLLAGFLTSSYVAIPVHAQTSLELGSVTAFDAALPSVVDDNRAFIIQQPTLEMDGGVKANAVIVPTSVGHAGEETVIFELFNGTSPVGIAAVTKDITGSETLTAHFNTTGSGLSVKVFVVDSYSGKLTEVGNNLADPVTIEPNNNVKVQLLGINDFHGQLDYSTTVGDSVLGGAAYLATYLKQREQTNPNTLLVHNGDSVGASSPVSALDRDKPTLNMLDLLGFDVATLGNHEFDQGVPALMAQLNGGPDPVNPNVTFDKTTMDYVNANVIDKETGKPIIAPYVIEEVGGEKIGFIGVVTMLTPSKVSPAALEPVNIVEQAPVVNAAVTELKEQGVKAIVVLAHDPASQSGNTITGEAADLANAVDDEVDVIFSGDNHVKVNGTVDNKLIFQAYSYGTAFADVDLEIDPATHDIVKKTAEIVDVKQAGITPDPAVAQIVQDSLDRHPELLEPVGSTDNIISKANAYTQENALGSLIADAMKDAMQSDFSFMNPGGIRADLPKGSIVYSDLFRIQPFGNQLVKMTLTGAQIKTLLQQQWGAAPSDTKTLQISGLKYTADFSKPIAERVTSLTKEDGTPINDTDSYTAVVNNFMAAGGDNYTILTQGSDQAAGSTDIEAFYKYVLKTFDHGKITASIKGRITNINMPTAP